MMTRPPPTEHPAIARARAEIARDCWLSKIEGAAFIGALLSDPLVLAGFENYEFWRPDLHEYPLVAFVDDNAPHAIGWVRDALAAFDALHAREAAQQAAMIAPQIIKHLIENLDLQLVEPAPAAIAPGCVFYRGFVLDGWGATLAAAYTVLDRDPDWVERHDWADGQYRRIWVSDAYRATFQYAEGDLHLTIARDDSKWQAEYDRVAAWHARYG